MKPCNCRAVCLLFVAVVAMASSAASRCRAQDKLQATTGPSTPHEAGKHFRIPAGLRIELVAAEPQIESPIAMAFDEDGRLWVVEMSDYPSGPSKGQKPAGRIRILEDKDGDGFFETASTWADHLLFANGISLWQDGAIVTMAPKIVHFRDPGQTGKATQADALYVGFAEQNPQLRVSHPILGLDGWIYCANGLRGGKVARAAVGDGKKENRVVDLSGMDFRFDPVHLDSYEAITGPGQYGNTFDAWGNRFVCDNRHHLRHVVMENRYVKRNPYLAAPALVEDISVLEDGPLNSGGKVYPISKNWTTSSLHEGRFTAACSVFIYHGKLLDTSPQRPPGICYNGAAFTCEPTGNLVHMELLSPKGATFSSKPFQKGVEFLATTDDWCRPVFLTHGPEGALYMVDMYRAVIEHPEWMPPELKNRPDLTLGKDKGRIWRIVPEGHKTKTSRPGLSKASIAELVKTLEHEEPWYRTTAQRLLLQKNDKAMIEPLTKLLKETKSPHAKILAAWMLERQGKLGDDMLKNMMVFEHPRVREHAVRLIEPRLQKDRKWLDTLGDFHGTEGDGFDSRLNFQRALSSGGLDNELIAAELVKLDFNNKDRWMRLAVQSALPKHAMQVMWWAARMGQVVEYDYSLVFRQQAALIASQKDPATYLQAFYLSSSRQRRFSGWAGLAEGLERRGVSLISVVDELPEADRKSYAQAIDKVFSETTEHVRDAKLSLDDRLMDLRILTHAPWPTAKQVLMPLVTEEATVELRIAALRALAAQQDKEVPGLLMKLWPGAAPSLRREILEAMLRQPARVEVLLDEIESNRMKAGELDPLRTRQLMNHANVEIRKRAKKLLADNLPADRQKVLGDYQAAVTMKGDAKNGREVFKKNCATCHRVAGIGTDVGPDIADTRTKTLGALLNDIIVPNAAIDSNYVNYLVTTKSGKSLTGVIASETAASITLRRAEGQTDTVLRQDIDTIESTGVSLMPDGLEKSISVAEMADLLVFLKNWRYLDGAVPLK